MFFRSNHEGYVKRFVSILRVFRNKACRICLEADRVQPARSPVILVFLSCRHCFATTRLFLQIESQVIYQKFRLDPTSLSQLSLSDLPGSRRSPASSKSRHLGTYCLLYLAITLLFLWIKSQVICQKFRLDPTGLKQLSLSSLHESRPSSASSKFCHFGTYCLLCFAITLLFLQIKSQVMYQKFHLDPMSI